ncbi:hypothetical protein NKH24_29520 [Mesorhizobium sp. M1300]
MGVEQLTGEQTENLRCHRRHVRRRFLRGELAHQPERPLQTLGSVDAELSQQAANHVHELRALLDQKIEHSRLELSAGVSGIEVFDGAKTAGEVRIDSQSLTGRAVRVSLPDQRLANTPCVQFIRCNRTFK